MKYRDCIKEIKDFSFGDKGTLRFYPKQFQKGYLQALRDLENILRMIDKEEKKEK